MSYQQIQGEGLWIGADPRLLGLFSVGFVSTTLNATGMKLAFIGRVFFPARTGTKNIRRVGFKFGTVVKAGGSGLTVSLQDIDTANGPPARPDETQDQTVAIANGDSGFTSNGWYRTGTLSADRTVSHGDFVCVVIEFDGSGRLGADSIQINCAQTYNPAVVFATPSLKSGGTWALVSTSTANNVVLEFSDGTFGSLMSTYPVKALNTHTYNSGSAADEFAVAFTVVAKRKIDGLRAILSLAGNTSDFDLVLYSGTTVLATVSVDANTFSSSAAVKCIEVPIPETELVTGTTYYISVKPTTTNNLSAFSLDVDDANQLVTYPGGANWNFTSRVDGGAWAAVTTTRLFMAGYRVSQIDDGTGTGGAGGSVIGSSIIKAA